MSSLVFLPQTCFFSLGYLLTILWDNYFVPQFFSLNLQAPLPSHPFHDQFISEVSAGCENRRNEMGAFNLTPSHLETCKPWKYFFLCTQASVVWRPPFLQFCQGLNSCMFPPYDVIRFSLLDRFSRHTNRPWFL